MLKIGDKIKVKSVEELEGVYQKKHMLRPGWLEKYHERIGEIIRIDKSNNLDFTLYVVIFPKDPFWRYFYAFEINPYIDKTFISLRLCLQLNQMELNKDSIKKNTHSLYMIP